MTDRSGANTVPLSLRIYRDYPVELAKLTEQLDGVDVWR